MSISQTTASRKLLALGAATLIAGGIAALVIDGAQIGSLRGQVAALNARQTVTERNAGIQLAELSQAQRQVNALEAKVNQIPRLAGNCPVTGSGPYQSCVRAPDSGKPSTGQEITDGAGSNPGTPWLVTDHNGAPMAWVNLFGLYSGGDGHPADGGFICVTYRVSALAACLTPAGTLTLTPTGPKGPTGPSETLTAADIAWIHAHGG